MSNELFNIIWFIIFILVIFIAFIANMIIILAIFRDKSMHTSTYFYIINVNIADIILVLSCLPERIAAVVYSSEGFHLGRYTCYLLPFLQQVSLNAALGFLLILTVHRCYPAGVPRFLQRNIIRQQIRNHSKTLCFIWIFAILINIPLFFITKYEEHVYNQNDNQTNISYDTYIPICETVATEMWSRTYLILLLVLTYLITGIFLIVIYGQVIRIILHSKKYQQNYLSTNLLSQEQYVNMQGRPSTSSTNSLNKHQQRNSTSTTATRLSIPLAIENRRKSSTSYHSAQHLQVIVMLFIVILLYILLLLPYRLFNLLFIVYNQLFQYNFMNEVLFHWLLNTVRLLVFLNCALQPIIYLVISSRLKQTVRRFLYTSCSKICCYCKCSLLCENEQHYKSDNRAIQAYLSQKHQHTNRLLNQPKKLVYRNNTHIVNSPSMPLSRPSRISGTYRT